ncbi:MAG: argininosuccinate lyase, partial [Burkholderiales bacterium]|nr:argininosuccinate lyase [Burkholderiales bacterium]
MAQRTFAQAADTGKLPCGTTAECNQQAAKVGATVAPSAAKDNTTSATDQAEDQFFWVNKINKASAVMLTEEKILTPEMGQKIAKGASHAIAQAKQPGGKRPADVLQIEAIISEAIGADASLIHTGRSR